MKLSLRSTFGIVTSIAILLAMASWRLHMHREWSRIEQDLMNAGVEFGWQDKFDLGLPDLVGVNSRHSQIADVDCAEPTDATRLAELTTVKTMVINCGSHDATLRAKLPAQVSAKYVVVINKVPPEVYSHVAQWHTIEEAEISTQTWTVEAAKAFAKYSSVRVLSCSKDDEVDDKIAAELLQLPKLRELDLTMTWVTDATIDRIAKMPHLKKVDLSGSQVTHARVQWLRKALPATNVVFTVDAAGNRY